jgi:hypothetical protein
VDEAVLHGLRWVLLADELSWLSELRRLTAPLADDLDALQAVHAMLVARLPDAAPLYRARMTAMVDEIALAVARAQALTTQPVGELLAEVVALDEALARLDAEREAAIAARARVVGRLAGRLTPGAPVEIAGWRASLEPARRGCVVTDPSAVPFDCCRMVPDEARLAARLAQTGVAPPGTVEVTHPSRVSLVRASD